MSLLSQFLPQHQFSETHSVVIAAPASNVLTAAATHDPVNDRLIGVFIGLRELPNRLAGALGLPASLKQRPKFGLADFLPLGRDGDRELAFGLVGRFWATDYGLVRLASPEAFAAYQEPGVAKLVLNFSTSPEGAATRLTTTTQVYCPDEASRRRFRPYWLLIRPVSGLIRRRILGQIKAAAESGRVN